METDFSTNVYSAIIAALTANAEHNKYGYWTDGDTIYCKTGEQADVIANLLTDCGWDVVLTAEYKDENLWAVYPD